MTYSPLAITKPAEAFGFSANRSGGHLSRSMMLPELTVLINQLPQAATLADYRTAIVDDNLLGKPTVSSRKKSFRHLVELYGLSPELTLFRVLRQLSADDPISVPLLAMTCVFCRDEQLRASFDLLSLCRSGEVLERVRMEKSLEDAFPGRFSDAMKKSLAQNVNTTWTESGHLTGRSRKVRAFPTPRQMASVYAMFAGYLFGLRGDTLLNSVFGQLVANDPSILVAHLSGASGRGLLRFRHAGGITEVDFTALLTPFERQVLHGAH